MTTTEMKPSKRGSVQFYVVARLHVPKLVRRMSNGMTLRGPPRCLTVNFGSGSTKKEQTMDSKYFLGKTITSIAAVLALGVVALPAHASNTTAEFAQQLDQSDGVKSSDALWTNTADGSTSSPTYSTDRAVSSPPYGNDSAVSVPGSSGSAVGAARAGQQEQSGGSDMVTTPSDATTSAPAVTRDPAQVRTPPDQPKY
jgi:hypothetical protein